MNTSAHDLSSINARIVGAALSVATLDEALEVQTLIGKSLGATHKRPVGDRPNNHGLMGSSGSYDLKLIELVTNMQDGVLERLALRKWGSADVVPYRDPHEAARALIPGSDLPEHPVRVEFRQSNPPATKTKRLTAVFRDHGCGLRPEQLPTTVFQLGGSYKEDRYYLQGAFGMGGAMTYRNAEAVVVVSRRDPTLLEPGQDDRITVAVVEWEKLAKGSSAYYLVDGPWREAGDKRSPWSCPASDYPEFEVGTHLAVISYRVDGLQRVREGDAKTFDTMVNTRLFNPVVPVRFTNHTTGRDRSSNLRGLAQRLVDNLSDERPEGEETLPFNSGGVTYQLPVKYWVFAKPDAKGARKTFVAADHAVLFLSNGQVHHHWTPSEFRAKSKTLKKLYDRVLVTVDTDELPIQMRTGLFTADRSSLVRSDPAIRLEEAVWSFLDDWEPLKEENSKLIREALHSGSDKSTLEISRRIGRALSVKGFDFGGGAAQGTAGNAPGPGGAGGGGANKRREIVLHPDPTVITGPAEARAEIGKTRSISFTVDAVDDFFTSGRGSISVTCGHRDIGAAEITVGQVRGGRFRVMIAVPEGIDPAVEELRVSLNDWFKASGGLGSNLSFTCKLELVDAIEGTGRGAGKPTGGGSGSGGAQGGGHVALVWTDHESQEAWKKTTVGAVEMMPADVLAAEKDDYKDLAALGQTRIPVVMLNQEYPPFKQYLAGRSKTLVDLDEPRSRYALGVAVHLVLLDQELQERAEKGEVIDDTFTSFAQQAAARAVLAVMPAFDEMAKAAGLDD
ncbi:hypothetical protein [Prescottella equi]|uniref:hypothetical protein n=1 Tax=Rhodococcus hoagii TaxID=43767 RepID=UPI00111C1186|nr:hypothetical protein [Prescottella equi]